MRSGITVIAVSLLAGGCALPIPIQVASWALDGISVLATQKTLADHGVSTLVQRDCAIWRGIADGEVCRDDDGAIAVATISEPPPAISTAPVAAANVAPVSGEMDVLTTVSDSATVSVDELAAFETAAGPVAPQPYDLALAPAAAPRLRDDLLPSAAAGVEPSRAVTSEAAKMLPAAIPGAEKALTVSATVNLGDPVALDLKPTEDRLYWVIGSFEQRSRAEALARRYKDFSAEVVIARLDGRSLYRVAVGPLAASAAGGMRHRLTTAGIADAWMWRAPGPPAGLSRQAPPTVGFLLHDS